MSPCLELVGVEKSFGRSKVLRGLDLAVGRGEIVGLLGPNGSGKTTTLRLVAGALAPDRGTIRVCGLDLASAPREARRRIGYLPERPPLYDALTVTEYLGFVAAAKGLRRSDAARAIAAATESFDLGLVRRRMLGRLSKGFRQRVGLAQACLGAPALLLLDEATSGLDPVQIVEARAFIRRGSAGRGVLLSSHIMQEIATLCTRVVVLHEGKVIAVERPVGESGAQALHVEVAGISPEQALALVRAVPDVASATRLALPRTDGVALRIDARPGADVRAAVAAALGEGRLLVLAPAAAHLEERFIAAIEASREASLMEAAQ
jgi:ABC-2 type transport system ATP-binding protein